MRLIDADKLDFSYCDNEFDCIFVVDKAPTIDAEPVRHGTWVGSECSICNDDLMNYQYDLPIIKYPFCPFCGAKMDIERKEK